MTTEFKFLESRYIKPVMEADGLRLHLKRQIVSGEDGDSSYSGSFAVLDTSSGETLQVTVETGNIIAGTTRIIVPETDAAVSSSCYVYIELTYSDSAYAAEIKTSSSIPSLSTSAYRVLLAEITVEDSKIKKITQKWQYGDIYVAGRFI